MEPHFFETPAAMRAWLGQHHETETELIVGFWKKATGRPSLTWSEAVDQALCFGWIDSVRHSLGDGSHTLRFTPRKPRSIWSAVNIAKVEALAAAGLMTPRGMQAFEARTEENSRVYSHEQAEVGLSPELEQRFRAHTVAWEWHNTQPPGYRRVATHWVMSAKRAETREKRLADLIAAAAEGRRAGPQVR